MSKSIDNSLNLKSIDGQNLSDEVVEIVNTSPDIVFPTEGIDHDGLGGFVATEHVDHIGVSLLNGTGISATGLGDLTASRTINLADTLVTPGTYGTSSQSSTITVDQQGRLTSATNTPIDHDALTNFVATEHIDWTDTGGATQNLSTTGTINSDNIMSCQNLRVGTNGAREYQVFSNASSLFTVYNNKAIFSAIPGGSLGTADVFIDGTSQVSINAGGSNAFTLTAAQATIFTQFRYSGSPATAGYYLQATDGAGNASWQPLPPLGETNTASNVGTGSQVFKQKTLEDLEFRTVVGGTGITATQNLDDITLTVDETNIDHDALANFVATEHVDHIGVSLLNGTGISATGLGDLTASRTINLSDTLVTPGTYGTSSQSSTITVDQQGRLTSATNTPIDHDGLTGYVATEHIDWTTAGGATDDFKTTGSVTVGSDYVISGPTPPPAPTNEYLFGVGSELIDTQGSNNLVVVGSPSPVFGPYNGRPSVVDFTGTTGYLQSSPFTTYTDIDFSISFYFNTTIVSGPLLSFTKLGDTNTFWYVGITGSGKINFLRERESIETVGFTTDNLYNDGAWHKVVIKCSLTSIEFFINDNQVPITFYAGTATDNTRVPVGCDQFRLGSDNLEIASPNIYLDDINLYNSIVDLGPGNTTINGSTQYTNKQTFNSLALTDGSQSNGYILMSDVNGNASWMGNRVADMYWEGNTTATDILDINTFYKVAVGVGLSILNPNAMGDWDLNGVENRLRYTGARGGFGHLGATISLTGGNGQVYELYITKNGVKLAGSLILMATANATAQMSSAIHCMTTIAQNDYFELFIRNSTSTNNDPTVNHVNMFCLIHG